MSVIASLLYYYYHATIDKVVLARLLLAEAEPELARI